jgi:hypothetical protein
MSWLFDRLCELAAADEVEVVLAAELVQPPRTDDSADLAEVLARAAAVPQLTVWVLPESSPQLTLDVCECIDLEGCCAAEAEAAVERLLSARRRSDAVLEIRADAAALVPRARVDQPLAVRDGTRAVRRLVATDRPGHIEMFGHRASVDLGIAIGGIDPVATVQVPGVEGAIAVIDALVTLRSFAFGVDGAEPSIGSLGRSGLLVD